MAKRYELDFLTKYTYKIKIEKVAFGNKEHTRERKSETWFLLNLLIYSIVVCEGAYESYTLRKHAYSNIQKISPPKTENFQIKKL